jgi:hypothetical protein
LLRVELADPYAFTHLSQLKLLGLVARELDHVQPGDRGAVLSMALQHARRPIKQPLESLDQYRPQRSCAEVAGHTLMAVQHALVVAQQREYVRKRVIIGNQRQIIFEMSYEIVDLEVIVRLGGFG